MSLRWLVLPAVILAGLIDAGYLYLIAAQRLRGPQAYDPLFLRPIFVAAFIAAMAVLAVATLLARFQKLQPGLLALSATGLLTLGWLAIFSIGLPLMIVGSIVAAAAVAAWIGSAQPMGSLQTIAGVVLALVVLVAGFELTERVISCPPTGYSSGGGQGFVTGPYHYQCINGRLIFRSGLCTQGGARFDASGRVVSTIDC